MPMRRADDDNLDRVRASGGDTEHRLTMVEGRIDDVVGHIRDLRSRMTIAESAINDGRVVAEQMKGALSHNTVMTAQALDLIKRVEAGTSELVAEYRSTPKLRENVRWWVYVVGTILGGVQVVVLAVVAYYSTLGAHREPATPPAPSRAPTLYIRDDDR